MNHESIKIGFFGTSDYSVMTLEALARNGYDVRFVVTMPDRPKGRGLVMTPSPVKTWAIKNKVPVFAPLDLKAETLKGPDGLIAKLSAYDCDVFVVIAYGKIIPEEILDIPPGKSLNIHASLLPRLRGASPIETAILKDEKRTGITIIRMDSKMDEGPIVAEKEVVYEPWPPTAEELGKKLVSEGNELLVKMLPDWIAGKIPERVQDHEKATYTKKITKEDGLIDWREPEYLTFRKIQAYHEWPGTYFFIERKDKSDGSDKKMRVKISAASWKDDHLVIEKVVPEGGREMTYADFLKGYGFPVKG